MAPHRSFATQVAQEHPDGLSGAVEPDAPLSEQDIEARLQSGERSDAPADDGEDVAVGEPLSDITSDFDQLLEQ